jgi:CheY-like chemotaxis protein/thiamine kinase-like enzyme
VGREFRILILDDDIDVCQSLENFLFTEGYVAKSVHTLDDAWECFKQDFYHLAILDINLRGREDRKNEDGLVLLRRLDEGGLLSATQIIMYSDYGNLQRYREAFARYHVEDFLEKDGQDAFEIVRTIQKIAAEKAQINLDLNTRWPRGLSPSHLVVNLNIDDRRVKNKTPQQAQLALELDDLLCRLFYQSESVLLKPLAVGHSGSAVMLATPFFKKTGAGQPVVVKFGHHRQIDLESKNYKEFVQPFIGGNHSTSIIELRRSLHLGGIVYSLLGSVGNKVESFSDFYAQAEVAEIKIVLQRLFHETCKQWYANRGVLQLLDLTDEYVRRLGLTNERIERALAEGLKGVQGKRQLYFDSLPAGRAFTNPVADVQGQEFLASTYNCSTHGDLNGGNILIDKERHVWLIDFGLTGPGHILRDFAELDTVIRHQLLKEEEATLEERLALEDALTLAERFSEVGTLSRGLQSKNAALVKAYETVVFLRQLAYQVVESNPADDVKEYNVALYYYSLNALRFYSWSQVQRQHALLSASILYDLVN